MMGKQVTVKRHVCLSCGKPCHNHLCRECFCSNRYRWTNRYNKVK